ncbi:hypothetical protein DPMN_052886 [Dreissena polymorpha]|uniref:Uncharacterized protein n=1 Tax=Dreissena polymorpha TaxID=45954 RepID=A0A9D4CKE8_DREPO|nr:hypothetical protein DPMN_052886 [Dreissena polymorpha]
MWTATPREKSKTGLQGIGKLKFLDSPPPRYRSEAPVCLGIFAVVTCPLLPLFCSKRC